MEKKLIFLFMVVVIVSGCGISEINQNEAETIALNEVKNRATTIADRMVDINIKVYGQGWEDVRQKNRDETTTLFSNLYVSHSIKEGNIYKVYLKHPKWSEIEGLEIEAFVYPNKRVYINRPDIYSDNFGANILNS